MTNSRKGIKYDWTKGDIHHVSIAVKDFDKYEKIFESFGGKTIFKGVAEEFNTECCFIDMGNMFIELIKGIKKDSPPNKFISKFGEGLHHIAINGTGTTKGALPGMKVKFNKPDKECRILIEEVDFN